MHKIKLMQDKNWNLYSDDSITFMFSESSKMLEETFKSFRESLNRSFLIVAVYSGFVTFCFNEAIRTDNWADWKCAYVIMFIGVIISILRISKNLLPSSMFFLGTEPNQLTVPYFENVEIEKQLREMKISKIISHQKEIDLNGGEIETRAKRFRWFI